jgi:cysteine sulfinate desulfinase/cysteine desulfurase-like protein
VLGAVGVSADVATAAIRFSLVALTTDASIDRVAEVFPMLAEKARRLATA